MPPIVTGVLGAYGVTPASAIIVALLAVATVMGVVQARHSAPKPAIAE
jgi:hypothetical protein